MANAFIKLTGVTLFFVVSASAILSLYSATNAVSVYSNLNVFASGIVCVLTAVAIGPLFCFIALYGFVRYLDLVAWEAVMVVLPAFLAWCTVATRTLVARFA